ncbi:BlaI/MecI/CopY family transcriptional regulator [Clostridiaceae bacterium M8S5]|nr:BlaI/MecI/CopY family transcriptional regulator [Clostridiaceae bacterium M8S5]
MKNVSISDSELEVMKLVWDKNPITSEEVIEELSDKMSWNPQTIKTFITRLVKKKVMAYNRSGRTYYYYPLVSKDEYVKEENRTFLQKIYDGAIDKLFLNFIKNEDISIEDIDRLQKLLEDKKHNKE